MPSRLKRVACVLAPSARCPSARSSQTQCRDRRASRAPIHRRARVIGFLINVHRERWRAARAVGAHSRVVIRTGQDARARVMRGGRDVPVRVSGHVRHLDRAISG